MIPLSLLQIAEFTRATGYQSSSESFYEPRAFARADTQPKTPWSKSCAKAVVTGVSTDTRTLQPGDLFVAIRGEQFDGHQFIDQAYQKRAVAVLGNRSAFRNASWCELEKRCQNASLCTLAVDDTIKALGALAAAYRREVLSKTTKVIAITGSNGKTTTKSMIDHVLKPFLPGRAAPKSFNNHIGVPLTILSGEAEDRYLIVEIGTNHPGEVAQLAAITQPDIGVITSIGEAHLEGLGSVQDIVKEKTSLLKYLRPGGLAVINIDNDAIRTSLRKIETESLITVGRGNDAQVRIKDIESTPAATRFVLNDSPEVILKFPGRHHTTNAAIAFTVSQGLGVQPNDIVNRLSTFAPLEGRTLPIALDGVTIIDDTYNANPTSVAAVIESLARFHSPGRRVLVLGDMLELGSQSGAYHQKIIRSAQEAGIEVLILVGAMLGRALQRIKRVETNGNRVLHYERVEALSEDLPDIVHHGDTVWLKGSRKMALDRAVEQLKQSLGQPATPAAIIG